MKRKTRIFLIIIAAVMVLTLSQVFRNIFTDILIVLTASAATYYILKELKKKT